MINQSDDRQYDPVSSAVLRLAREHLIDDATAEVHRRQRDRLLVGSQSAKRRRIVLPLALAASCALTLFVYRSQRVVPRQITHLTHVSTSSHGFHWTFSDGSTVELTPDARLAMTSAAPDGAELTLEEGSASLNIMPRTPSRPARWSVRAGAYVIKVRGTRFTVSWHAQRGRLDVQLNEGSVLVVGPRLGDGIILEPGQRLLVDPSEVRHTTEIVAPTHDNGTAVVASLAETTPQAALEPPSAPAPMRDLRPTPQADTTRQAALEPPSAPAPTRDLRPTPQADMPRQAALEPPSAPAPTRDLRPTPQADMPRLSGSWSALVEAGRFEEILQAAAESGITQCLAHCSERDLRALADAARLGGQSDLAEQALFAMRRRFADTLSGRTATFLIARLYEETHNDPARALLWFDRYLAEAPDDAYAADALGRKMMLLLRNGDEVNARLTASEYLRRFPGGPYAAPARKLNATR